MYFLRKFVSVLLVILCVPALGYQLLAATANATVLSPDFAKGQLQAGFYAGVLDLAASRMVDQFPSGPVRFTPEEARSLIDQVMPADSLRAALEPVIDSLYVWLLGTQEHPTLLIDLRAVRANVAPALRRLVNARLAALPACPAGTLPALDGGLPSCRLGGPAGLAMTAAVNAALTDERLTAGVPDRIDLTAEIEQQQGPAVWRQFDTTRRVLRTLNRSAVWGWGVIALLALLLWLLNRDRPHSFTGWLAWPALLGGLLFDAAAFLATGAALDAAPASDLLAPVWHDVFVGIRQSAVQAGAVTAAVGLGLLVALLLWARAGRSSIPPGVHA